MASTTPAAELPLGTAPQWEGMHRKIRRVCYVLLFGLVIEGALTFPLLAIWYGVPKLSPVEVCSELQKVMYADQTRKCETHPLNSPPLGGAPEAGGETTSQDTWGVQPKPGYDTVHYRDLVKNKEAREANAPRPTTTTIPDNNG
jgi:hypothetical protein